MKKALSFILLLAFSAAHAETLPSFPAFPMVIWGNIKIGSQDLGPGTVMTFFDGSGNQIGNYALTKSGSYGGTDPTKDLSPTFNEFSGNLIIKVTNQNGTRTVTGSEFSTGNLTVGCPATTAITFVSRACRYDIVLTPPSNTGTSTSGSGTVSFTDISSSFAKEDILDFAKRGLVKGYSDGTFRPEQPMTRAEFLALSIRSLGVSVNENVSTTDFSDIPESGGWMIKYLEAGKKVGIIGQVISGKKVFRPDDSISRAEALAMLFRLGNIAAPSVSSTSFTDVTEAWEMPYVEKASSTGIISGQTINGKKVFRPNDSITRAEALSIIKNASSQSK